jgi:tetratricopeptide (TPR) repeat protein
MWRWNCAVHVASVLLVLAISVTLAFGSPPAGPSRDQVVQIVNQIQRADYEGDRAALKRLYGELAPFIENKELAARVRYWRSFALWRRAINGFNDNVGTEELAEDLKQAWEEFNESAGKDPGFTDAKVGALSCASLLAFSIKEKSPARVQELIAQARQLRKEAEAAEPDNPRLSWVMGPNLWFAPPERGGGEAKAMEMYQKALETIRKNKRASDPLEPSWGEPELLMNLAWSNLNRSKPDLSAAEQDARAALGIVPYWHYVRDILMPQIRAAKAKQG